VDFPINLTGNLTPNALKGAKAVDVLTDALKAEERTAKALEVALLRASKGIDTKKQQKLSTALFDSKLAIAGLSAELRKVPSTGLKAEVNGIIDTGRAFAARAVASAKSAITDRTSAGQLSALGTAGKTAAMGLAVAGAALLALTIALGSAAVNAGTYALKAADAGRNTRLLNEAADLAGGTHAQLGAIVKQVAEGPTTVAKGRLGELAREMRTLRFDSRTTQVSLSAMATAESALGQGASGAIKAIAEQSKASRRFMLGARDLYGEYTSLAGTGLGKKDVFSALAKQLNTSVGEAELRFKRGGVTVRQGMQAIEEATKTKFGGVVEKQLLGLDNQFGRFREDVGSLFAGVNIEPFLKGLKLVTGILSDTTAGGRATRLGITQALDDLAARAAKVFPYVESFLYGFGTGALNVYTESIKPLLDSFSTDIETGGIEGSFTAGEKAAKAFATTLAGVLETLNAIIDAGKSVSRAIDIVTSPIETAKKDVKAKEDKAFDIKFSGVAASAQEATDAGVRLTAGITRGIHLGTPEAVRAVEALADAQLSAFKARNEIRSPSRKYERESEYIPEGAARGVRKGTPEVQEAIADMTGPMGSTVSAKSGASGSSRDLAAELTLNLRWPSGEMTREVHSVLFRAREGGPRSVLR
jgi:hypothetical protein